MNYYLGIDFGTSGARAVVIDQAQSIVTRQQSHFCKLTPEQLPQMWQNTLYTLIAQIPLAIRKQLKAIAINGTSSTVLLCDASGDPITSPILYHDSRGQEVLDKIKAIAPKNHVVITGTTDSIAAFLASGASLPGEAVTSLGSTLVLKLLSQTKVNNSNYGIYSHRLGKLWLTGGASNTGGAVLKHFFSQEQLQDLSEQIDPTIPSNLNYYPLLTPGDRFPINNPNLAPHLEPRPTDSVEFLHGLLESIARIEALGYQKLQNLGADQLTCVYTAGGGASNLPWSRIRQRHLSAPVKIAANTDAAYGTALLAANQPD